MNVLGFVQWVHKDGAIEVGSHELLQHKHVEPLDGACGHEDVKPRVGDLVPQAEGSELDLDFVQPVEKLEVSGIRLKQKLTVELQRRQQALHHLRNHHNKFSL